RVEPVESTPPAAEVAAAKAPEATPPAQPAAPAARREPPTTPPAQPEPPRAPMNVPSRPRVVTPAGPQLTNRAPVKLSGPKVVRVEAPDIVEAPRSRRPAGDSGFAAARGPRSGMGVPGAGDDDRSRSPRRGPGGMTANKRR